MLGTSQQTSLVGWVIIAGDLIKLAIDVIREQGLPSDIQGWIGFGIAMATGIGLILAKDANKSNAPVPAPVANVVPPAS